MWLALKGSTDCFDSSIYTIESYKDDLKDIFTAIVDNPDRFPLLNSIDWYGHTFVQDIKNLRHELIELSKIEINLANQIAGLLNFIENTLKKVQGNHYTFLFDGM